ncbi:MAG: TM0106 family RecB-like putative nuclease [Planctomycetes bacterium]|jgi:uncharacterized protein|nr:TM0106 family RecB-like putative nuclease [Planctomycetota bacterium]
MPRAAGRTLSPTDVAHHLACQHRTQLQRRRHEGTLPGTFTPDARLEAMIERGLAHERAYLEQLQRAGLRLVDLNGPRDPARTRAAMQAGADVLVQAPLGNDTFAGVADVLRRCDRPSALGNYSYEPVDTKLAAETKAGALLQLLTYCELLAELQGTLPERFYVVTPHTMAQPEEYRTADYSAYFRVIRDHLRDAASAEPRPSTYPEPVPHCDVCAYWQHCDRQRLADDHPSRIAGAQRGHVRELQRQQLPTLTAFAAAGGLPAPPLRGRTETYAQLAHQARLQLAATTSGAIPVDALPLEPGRGLFRLPKPSPGDVFLDFEGDPFVGSGGLEYLTGYCYRDDRGELVQQSLWALDATEEKRALVTFLDFVAARRAQHQDLHIYHFAPYEPAALRRMCARHDTHGPVLDELLRGKRFVDLHTIVREAFRIGVDSYGLKPLEAVIGFPRQLDLRTAGIARRDLELALELDRPEQLTAERRQLVADYNRDDCRATLHLRDWLERQLADALAGGADIPRPPLGVPEAKEELRAHELRLLALRTALTQDLPAVEQRSEEHKALALLGDLVGYFAREVKSAWWEVFRLRELPPEGHLDDRGMLAGLVPIRTIPRQGRQERDRYVFHFPPQETAIEDNDTLFCTELEDVHPEGGMTSGQIDDLDLARGEITISLPDHVKGRLPTAMLRKPFLPPDSIQNGMTEFAEQVRDHGFDRAERGAAIDLLLRKPPRLTRSEPMQMPGETAAEALVRLCLALDGGVLPVQGPPGTGKTFTGAHAITALIKAGRRVGVVAVSHKVIDNLLVAVSRNANDVPVLHVDKKNDDRVPRAKNEKAAIAAISRRTVVGGTAYFWVKLPAEAKLDYLFVDEAGQMSLAQVLAFARAAKNLILLGDPQQLEQPHKGAHPDGADVAALTHLLAGAPTLRADQGLFLAATWRLPPSICAFTSELYYQNRLQPVAGAERQRLSGTGLGEAGTGLWLLEVPHTGNQASSPEEVEAVVALVHTILRPGAMWTDRDGTTVPLGVEHVLVIAPYNAQVGALRRALQPLGITKVGTVDKFQGQEAPVVLYSCTSSSATDAPRGLGFLYDPHRLNVATSRASGAFVMVASPQLFAAEVKTPEQMRMANGMCRFREVATRLLGSTIPTGR